MRCAFYEHIAAITTGLGKELGKEVELDIFFGSSSRVIDVPGCQARTGFLGFPTYRNPVSVCKLLRQTTSLRHYDMVHVQSTIQGLSAYFANRIFGTPYIYSNYGIVNLRFPSQRKVSEKEHQLLPRIAKRASTFVTTSNFVKKHLMKEYGLNPQVIYTGADPEIFNPHINGESVRREHGIKERIILSVMRLHPYKDPFTFLQAAAQVVNKVKAKFVIVGRGILENQVKAFIEKNNLSSHILLLPYVEYLNHYFASCDVFVLTSIDDALPTVVIEAMACGKPVIGTDSGGIPEIIGDSGLLFKPRDSADLADKILWLLSNKSEREEFATKAYRRTQKIFRWDITARKYLELYRKAM